MHGSYPTLSTEELIELFLQQSAEGDAERELSASIIRHSKTPAVHIFSLVTDVSEDDKVPAITRIGFCLDVLSAAFEREESPIGLLATISGESSSPIQFVSALHYLAKRGYTADAIIRSDLLHRYFISLLGMDDELTATYTLLRKYCEALAPDATGLEVLRSILVNANKILCDVRGCEDRTVDGEAHSELVELQRQAAEHNRQAPTESNIDYLSLLPAPVPLGTPITVLSHSLFRVERQLHVSLTINDNANLDNLFHLYGVSLLVELLKYLVTDLTVPAGSTPDIITALMNRNGKPVDWLFTTLRQLDDDSLCEFVRLLMNTDAQFREDDTEKRSLIYFYLCSYSLRVEQYQMLYRRGSEWFAIFAFYPILDELEKDDFDKLFTEPKWPVTNPVAIETALMWLASLRYFGDYEEQIVTVAFSYFLRQSLFPMREPQAFSRYRFHRRSTHGRRPGRDPEYPRAAAP